MHTHSSSVRVHCRTSARLTALDDVKFECLDSVYTGLLQLTMTPRPAAASVKKYVAGQKVAIFRQRTYGCLKHRRRNRGPGGHGPPNFQLTGALLL